MQSNDSWESPKDGWCWRCYSTLFEGWGRRDPIVEPNLKIWTKIKDGSTAKEGGQRGLDVGQFMRELHPAVDDEGAARRSLSKIDTYAAFYYLRQEHYWIFLQQRDRRVKNFCPGISSVPMPCFFIVVVLEKDIYPNFLLKSC